MQIDNIKLLEALKHPGGPDAVRAEVSKELKGQGDGEMKKMITNSTD